MKALLNITNQLTALKHGYSKHKEVSVLDTRIVVPPNRAYFYFVDLPYLVRQKRTYDQKIIKIVLLFYCISNLSLAFSESSRGGGQKRVNQAT